ncbi:MAG: hypothetical protein ACOYBQ_02845 [Fluviibacter sp.]|jgi:hypothetical protein
MTVNQKSFVQRVAKEAHNALRLTIYFGVWFSAIGLLTHEILRQEGLPFGHWGLAWIKAALCAKFMLIGQAMFPMPTGPTMKPFRAILPRSFVYLAVVFALSVLENGLDGLLHGRSFVASIMNFADGDPLYAFAMAWVYWMILMPYLLFDELLGMRSRQERSADRSVVTE